MPQSLARILVHTVFSTKDRRPSLRDTALRKELHHYLGGGVMAVTEELTGDNRDNRVASCRNL